MFETERCTITTLQKSDYWDVEKIYANQEVKKFLGVFRNDDSFSGIVEEMLTSSQASSHWGVREKQTESMIGLVSLDLHHEVFIKKFPINFYRAGEGKGMLVKQFRSSFIMFYMN